MLALLGFTMMAVFMYLIMSKRITALNALMLIPIVFALIGGFTDLGPMMTKGITDIAPTGIMLLFAIMYFGLMIDTGLFDPLVEKILKLVKGDPLKIVIGTAVLSMVVALDGDGATTYMITVSAMLPLYKRLKMNPYILACVPALVMGIANMIPWGGPTARVMSVLHLDPSQVFTPVIPAMVGGLIWVFFVAYIFGKKERKRLGIVKLQQFKDPKALEEQAAALETVSYKGRTKVFWVNLVLTIALLVGLVMSLLPANTLFMIAFSIALMINYPKLKDQHDVIAAQAKNAMAVVSLVFAAGIFTGILAGTKMVDAIAQTLVSLIPAALGPHLPIITALISMPFTYIMANDPFYFGIIPILAKTAATYGIDPVEIGRASILGQPLHLISPLVGSVYLLVGMVGVDFGEHQKFTMKWAVGTALVMMVVALITGIISL